MVAVARGYTDVTTTHGPSGGAFQTVSKKLFYRGMHGDSLASGDNPNPWSGIRAVPLLRVPITVPGQTGCIDRARWAVPRVPGILPAAAHSTATAVILSDCFTAGPPTQGWRYNLDTYTFKNINSRDRCLQEMGT